MARAHEHLASARYAEAAGAFRAVLRIDPNEFQAHFGLADALVARGQRSEAVEGLVAAAESCTAREDHGAALTLYGKALAVDPMRLELHLDVAMAEAALGRMEAAQSRLEHLAEVYMQAGRTDEAAEVYRCLAGWEGDGEEAEAQAEPAAQRRTTQVPTSAPAQPPPRYAVPMAIPSSETVVIPTILITPDGQLLQVPIEQQAQAWAPASEDSVPPIPVELLEVVHSAPLDLAGGEGSEEVERTVVAFPPPPPSLPEEYESAAHPIDRSELEAAVVAAMDNLAQLEEEDMTLVMQRLPPQPKGASLRTRSGESRLPEFVTRSRLPKPELPPEPELELEADADLADDAGAHTEPEPEPAAEEPAPESKLRIRPAPRPVAKPAPVGPVTAKASAPAGKASAPAGKASAPAGKASAPTGASKPGVAPARASAPASTSKPAAAPARASAPASASKPVAAPTRAGAPASASKPAAAPARASTTSKPAPVSTPTGATNKPSPLASKPASTLAKPGAASKPAAASKPSVPAGNVRPAAGPAMRPSDVPPPGETTKPTRPNNPLAERLRRRAGLQKPDAAPGRPTEPRPTEPIIVRSPSKLPPVNKKK